MITESNNPFLILDTAGILINEFRFKSEYPPLSLNQLRLVSSLFRKIIDANSFKLYPDFAFKCREAYLKFLAAQLLYEGDSWTHVYALDLARQTYYNEKITYDFFSIFSGPVVTFEGIHIAQRSFSEVQRDLKYNVPRQLFRGYDAENGLGPFVTGSYYYGKRKKERMFLVSPKIYIEYREVVDRLITINLPSHQYKYRFLNDLMQKGFAYDGKKKCQWIGYEDWERKI